MTSLQKSPENAPRVSAVIPAFNRKKMLKRAVRSVLDQSFQDIELLVVDDGSTDDLSEIERIVVQAGHRFLRKSNGGVSSARNLGVAHTNAPWIAFLDSDDEWLPQKVEKQLSEVVMVRQVT